MEKQTDKQQIKIFQRAGFLGLGILLFLFLPSSITPVYAVEVIRKTGGKEIFSLKQIKEKVGNFFFEQKEEEIILSKKGILVTAIGIIFLGSLIYQSHHSSISRKLANKNIQEIVPSLVSPLVLEPTESWKFLKNNKTVGFRKIIANPLLPFLLNTDFQELLKKEMQQEDITNLIFAFKEFKGI